MVKTIQVFLVATLILFSTQVRGGKLDKTRDIVNSDNSSGKSTSTGSSTHGHDHHDQEHDDYDDDYHHENEDTAEDLNLFLAIVILGSPFYGPHLGLEPTEGSIGYFPPYPYRRGHKGSMQIVQSETQNADAGQSQLTVSKPVRARHFTLKLAAEYAYDMTTVSEDFNVHRPNGLVQIDTSSRIGVETRWRYFFEHTGNTAQNAFWMGDVNLMVRFAQSQRTQFRLGLGPKFMIDKEENTYGFTILAYSVDFFPAKPLTVSAYLDFGVLGGSLFGTARATIGAMLGPIELYVGYDGFGLTSNAGSQSFHGPLVGLKGHL